MNFEVFDVDETFNTATLIDIESGSDEELSAVRLGLSVVIRLAYRTLNRASRLLHNNPETRATYISAPPMVANYIDRPEALRALRDTLFGADGHRAVALTALEGMGCKHFSAS